MKHVMYIPAESGKPIEACVVNRAEDIEALLSSDALEFWPYVLGDFEMVWLHHADDLPINMRATVLAEDFGRHPGNPPLRGDVVVKGVTLDGDWVDVTPGLFLEMA